MNQMNPHHNFLLFTDGVSYSDHISRIGKPPEERALLATKKSSKETAPRWAHNSIPNDLFTSFPILR